MSISNKNIIEINMIKDIINNCDRDINTKNNLVKILDSIIKVADKIIEWEDYINENDNVFECYSTDEDEDSSDGDYFPTILIPTPI